VGGGDTRVAVGLRVGATRGEARPVYYVVGGVLVGLVLHRITGMRCENAIQAIMGMYGSVVVLGVIERNWPWVLYYVSATMISVAVLWMGRK